MPSFNPWLQTPPGQHLLRWEQSQLDAAVADIFGYHSLQLGLPALDALRCNRMPHRWLALERAEDRQEPGAAGAALVTDFAALPFPEASLDLLVLPHALEVSHDPHTTLREAARVLVPEGRMVISCFNPTSLWGWRQQRAAWYRRAGMAELYLPESAGHVGYWRLRDWLRLLSFEVESAAFGCYGPAVNSESMLRRFAWMDRMGERWWPILGAAYVLVAVKRVRGMRLIGPAWRSAPARAGVPVSAVNRAGQQPPILNRRDE